MDGYGPNELKQAANRQRILAKRNASKPAESRTGIRKTLEVDRTLYLNGIMKGRRDLGVKNIWEEGGDEWERDIAKFHPECVIQGRAGKIRMGALRGERARNNFDQIFGKVKPGPAGADPAVFLKNAEALVARGASV